MINKDMDKTCSDRTAGETERTPRMAFIKIETPIFSAVQLVPRGFFSTGQAPLPNRLDRVGMRCIPIQKAIRPTGEFLGPSPLVRLNNGRLRKEPCFYWLFFNFESLCFTTSSNCERLTLFPANRLFLPAETSSKSPTPRSTDWLTIYSLCLPGATLTRNTPWLRPVGI